MCAGGTFGLEGAGTAQTPVSALQDILQLIASARERLEEEKRLQEDKEAERKRARAKRGPSAQEEGEGGEGEDGHDRKCQRTEEVTDPPLAAAAWES